MHGIRTCYQHGCPHQATLVLWPPARTEKKTFAQTPNRGDTWGNKCQPFVNHGPAEINSGVVERARCAFVS